jgi:hypothetical protein
MPGGETGTGAHGPGRGNSMTGAPAGRAAEDPAGLPVGPEPGKPAIFPRLSAGLVMAAAAGICLIAASGCKSSAGPAPFQDLGAGVSNVTGLKGSLKARWAGNAAQYQLEIEPISPLESAGFSYVMANPPGPLVLHMKLMDATGYAVCGKDVLFPFDRSRPGEAERERGQDLLQATTGDDGKVVSLSAQGILPCTAEQYRQADYWDFSTNFPTLAEQDELRRRAAALKARQEAQRRAAEDRQKAGSSAFYMEGDDQAAGYDAARKVLETQLSRSFLVAGQGQQTTASLWASDGILFRYKCDQHSRCVLTSAGGRQSLSVTALQ